MKKFGVQIYTVRDKTLDAASLADTLKKIKAIGYDTIQTGGALPRLLPEEADPYAAFARMVQEAGLEVAGTFEDFDTIAADPAGLIARHAPLNTRNIGIGSAGGFGTGFTMEEITSLIEKFNTIAREFAPYGYRFDFHNHAHEFSKVNGKPILDHFIEGTDPGVAFCFDTYWAQVGGVDVRHYIKKLAGRIDILHLKDYGRTPSESFTAVIGDGNLYWDGIMEEAQAAGVKHYVVEQDDCRGEDSLDALARSREFLEKYR